MAPPFAVMSNHYHVVLKINRKQALALDDTAVIKQWIQLYPTNALVKRLSEEQENKGHPLIDT